MVEFRLQCSKRRLVLLFPFLPSIHNKGTLCMVAVSLFFFSSFFLLLLFLFSFSLTHILCLAHLPYTFLPFYLLLSSLHSTFHSLLFTPTPRFLPPTHSRGCFIIHFVSLLSTSKRLSFLYPNQ
ncbi:MAG: hypothetical protein BYD32DRAFT_408498 [Podila humilis]|nr:MAG: hypothetical protein BYD32DRAFT_408498 [Podila humilis]